MTKTPTLTEIDRRLRAHKLNLENAIAAACVIRRKVLDAQEEADESDKEVERMNDTVLEIWRKRNEFLRKEKA